jgi:hypothetical protein
VIVLVAGSGERLRNGAGPDTDAAGVALLHGGDCTNIGVTPETGGIDDPFEEEPP